MLNIVKPSTLIILTTLILTACGEENAPATSTANEPASPAITESQPVAENPVAVEPVADNEPETVATEDPLPEPAAVEAITPATTPETAANTAPVDGGHIYNTYCAICHKAGMNAAPKFGSKPLWVKRIAQGRETVYKNAIDGLRAMPPRGGFTSLTDAEVKAGVDYMIRAAGGWQD